MEPAVKRVLIFFAALRAHCEGFHRGMDTIVRESIDDRKTRATVCAVGKRVEVAAIVGIEYVTQTILASRDVRQNQSQVFSLMVAVTNLKNSGRKEGPGGSIQDSGSKQREVFLAPGGGGKCLGPRLAFNLDEYPLWRVEHPATKIHLVWRDDTQRAEILPLERPPG